MSLARSHRLRAITESAFSPELVTYIANYAAIPASLNEAHRYQLGWKRGSSHSSVCSCDTECMRGWQYLVCASLVLPSQCLTCWVRWRLA